MTSVLLLLLTTLMLVVVVVLLLPLGVVMVLLVLLVEVRPRVKQLTVVVNVTMLMTPTRHHLYWRLECYAEHAHARRLPKASSPQVREPFWLRCRDW